MAFSSLMMRLEKVRRHRHSGVMDPVGVDSARSALGGLLIAVAGAVFRILVAVGACVINRFFQWRFDTALVFVRVTATIAWEAVAFAVPLGVAAGLAASWTLLRRSVVSLVGR